MFLLKRSKQGKKMLQLNSIIGSPILQLALKPIALWHKDFLQFFFEIPALNESKKDLKRKKNLRRKCTQLDRYEN